MAKIGGLHKRTLAAARQTKVIGEIEGFIYGHLNAEWNVTSAELIGCLEIVKHGLVNGKYQEDEEVDDG